MNTAPSEKDLSSRDRLAPGSRYELLARVASGGMGTVYLGRLRGPQGFRRLVALKRAHEHLVRDPGFAQMFRAEARVASRIHHPNVVAVHDIEEVDDELILVMDYIAGGALSSLLTATRQFPLEPSVALRILLDAAAGLEAAHSLTDDRGRPLGVVHRDVSPENVLVGADGVARISDFGVAKVMRATMGATDGTDLKGKLAYMAPECVRRGKVDARSDVFALGIVAWEAFTERRLFRAQSEVATLQRVIGMTPEPPSELRPGLPPSIDEVVLKALEKLPDDRYPSVRAFADALELAAREGGLAPATHGQVGEHVYRCVGHVLDARHRVLTEERPAELTGPLQEASGVRVTASIPRSSLHPSLHSSSHPALPPSEQTPTHASLPREHDSMPSGFVATSHSISIAARALRPSAPRFMAYAAAVVTAAAGLIFFLGEPAPTAARHARGLAARVEARASEMGGVLPETALPELPPAITPRVVTRYERPRQRVVRAPAPRDVAAPNPYGPTPSSSPLR